MVVVGTIVVFDEKFNMRNLIFGRKSLAGPLIDRIKETEEI